MRDEEGFYYFYNFDFRGRVYFMYLYLNYLSFDFCRGVFEFVEGRLLGESGLYWLKIYIVNLYVGGIDKFFYEERIVFVENYFDDIFELVSNFIYGNRWWLIVEDFF